MIVVDDFLYREHLGPQYNCFDFAREVRIAHDGLDIGHLLPWDRFGIRHLNAEAMKRITRTIVPVDGTFCVYQRPRLQPHVGIWWKGKLLHMPETGPVYQLERHILRRYPHVSYYL